MLFHGQDQNNIVLFLECIFQDQNIIILINHKTASFHGQDQNDIVLFLKCTKQRYFVHSKNIP